VSLKKLSPRQRQTLEQLLRGHARKQIASNLGISVNTVNEYVRAVYRAAGVTSRAELMASAVSAGPED
jgi:DNA-binding NarL/FixJ family response regulator